MLLPYMYIYCLTLSYIPMAKKGDGRGDGKFEPRLFATLTVRMDRELAEWVRGESRGEDWSGFIRSALRWARENGYTWNPPPSAEVDDS